MNQGDGGYGYNYYQPGNYNSGVEMQPLNGQDGYGQPATNTDPNAILSECRDLDSAVQALEVKLSNLRNLQKQFIWYNDKSSQERNGSSASKNLELATSDLRTQLAALTDRVRRLKGKPEAQNPRNTPQIGRLERRLKQAMHEFQRIDAQFRKDMQENAARQYRIVRPDAPEEEVQRAAEESLYSDQQIFAKALQTGNRSLQANSTLQAVKDRHAAIQDIEKTVVELAQLFQDLDNVIQEQEPLVENIEQKAEEVHDNVVKANTEIDGAITKARSRNRKKWWCLLVIVIIIIAIVVIAVVVTQVNKAATNAASGSA